MNQFGLHPKDYGLLQELVIKPLKKLSVAVYVFGSRARGTAQPYSDVDVLYELKEPEPAHAQEKISEIKESAEESQLTIKVDLVSWENLAASYREGVLRERIQV